MSIKTKLMTACAGVLLVGGISASVANAKVVVSIRGEDGASASKIISATDLNKPIKLNIYAATTGQAGKATAEYLSSLQGAIVSKGTTLGTIAPANSYPNPDYNPDDPASGPEVFGPMVPWGDKNADSYSFGSLYNRDLENSGCNGKPQDIDGDGDLDLGGKPGAGGFDWVALRTSVNGGINWGSNGRGTKLTDGGVEFLVGTITFTPTALGGPHTFVEWVLRTDASGAMVKEAGLWQEDGSSIASQKTGLNGTMEVVGFDVQVVPEPATLSLLGLGAAMLLGRRSRK